ncbi:MerR family transcriptional regulator [Streptomyces sp. NPDC093085]|uniref:MerR family transcriptional regulator n=1 Tax=Streptomyces sp. NPDC093085 TaxID=3155068 RepID=UPI00342F97D3
MDDTGGLWSIGELARRAGVTVKTVRFYSGRGLLPEAGRSSGGHRRYGRDALDRLRLIRSLRALDLPVTDVGTVLGQEPGQEGAVREDALEEVVAGRLRLLGTRLTALRWQEAALQSLRDCPDGERAERLRLVGALTTPPDTTALARFWRRELPARLPSALRASIVDAVVPHPPDNPSPGDVLAFARLHALVTGARPPVDHWRSPAGRSMCGRTDEELRPAVLFEGLREAFALAATEVRAHRAPYPGGALECFVAAHARTYGARDTPVFRRRLRVLLRATADPVLDRYWELSAALTGPGEPTLGAAQEWLRAALETELAGDPAPLGHPGVPA